MKHTPGPWELGRFKKESDIGIWAGHYEVAKARGPNIDNPEANARLIAAAPELLEACNVVLDRLSAWHEGARIANIQCPSSETRNTLMNYSHLIDVLAPAIAKAEGK